VTTGMVLGKFLPPHAGHRYLVDFALEHVDALTVLVCTLDREPIPGDLRFAWMREICPGARVVHVTEDLPQEPSEHSAFWEIWKGVVRRFFPEGPDRVFASEDYGATLAEVLGAEYAPVDPDRTLFPVSGTAIRRDPLGNWPFIPPCVRPYYAKRVCVFGPESTGKTTLTKDLAAHYGTVWVPEYARPLLDPKEGRCDFEDIEKIARGQAASEDALARRANRLLFCDTDHLTTTIWSEVLFGSCPAWIREEARRRSYDLTLLLDVDVPWVDDCQRYLPHEREAFLDRCRRALEAADRPHTLVSGSWEERFRSACNAVDRMLNESGKREGIPQRRRDAEARGRQGTKGKRRENENPEPGRG